MSESALPRQNGFPDPVREEAIRRARKKVRDMRAFFVSAMLYALRT
jgi:hypothetical protein